MSVDAYLRAKNYFLLFWNVSKVGAFCPNILKVSTFEKLVV